MRKRPVVDHRVMARDGQQGAVPGNHRGRAHERATGQVERAMGHLREPVARGLPVLVDGLPRGPVKCRLGMDDLCPVPGGPRVVRRAACLATIACIVALSRSASIRRPKRSPQTRLLALSSGSS